MILPLGDSLGTALDIISKFQKGEKKQILTGRRWFDYHGGLIVQSTVLIAGASFAGKTSELDKLRDDIMNSGINPDSDKYVWLSNAFEMTALSSAIRDLKKIFNKTTHELLNNPLTDEEQEKLLQYSDIKSDGRFFVNRDVTDPIILISMIEEFVASHQDKEAVFVDIDHAALLSTNSAGKKGSIDDFVEGINRIKLKYNNVIFIILTQLNRDILRRIEPKSNDFAIQRGDIYQSDTMFHISDYVYGLQNPYYFHIEEYRSISPNKYEHLSHRFTPPINKNGKVALYTENCIFVEILKDRFAEYGFIDIYTIEIGRFSPVENQTVSKPRNTMPLFEDGDETPF